jgi:hypothetical protein
MYSAPADRWGWNPCTDTTYVFSTSGKIGQEYLNIYNRCIKHQLTDGAGTPAQTQQMYLAPADRWGRNTPAQIQKMNFVPADRWGRAPEQIQQMY